MGNLEKRTDHTDLTDLCGIQIVYPRSFHPDNKGHWGSQLTERQTGGEASSTSGTRAMVGGKGGVRDYGKAQGLTKPKLG